MRSWLLWVVLLLAIGRIAEAIRAMHTTLTGHIAILQIAIADVRKQAADLEFPEKLDVIDQLDEALLVLAQSKETLPSSNLRSRCEMRKRLAQTARQINIARRTVAAYLPDEEE